MLRLGLIAGCISELSWVLALDLERAGIAVTAYAPDSVRAARSEHDDSVDVWLSRPDLLGRGGWDPLTRPAPRVPTVAMCKEHHEALEALCSGVRAVLMCTDTPWALTAAVHAAARQHPFLSPELLSRHYADVLSVLRPPGTEPAEPLTRRELDVLALLVQGLPNARIGAALHITRATVGSHVLNILRKLHATNRTEAAAVAYRLGLVDRAGPALEGALA